MQAYRGYETIYVLKPEIPDPDIEKINTRINGIIEKENGKVLKFENWGKRKLAYEIEKQSKGAYMYYLYLGGNTIVAEVERNLRMLDTVIRYNTVMISRELDPDNVPPELLNGPRPEGVAGATMPSEKSDDDRPMPRMDDDDRDMK